MNETGVEGHGARRGLESTPTQRSHPVPRPSTHGALREKSRNRSRHGGHSKNPNSEASLDQRSHVVEMVEHGVF